MLWAAFACRNSIFGYILYAQMYGMTAMASEPDIKALRYFVAVARHAGYSRAASEMRITQPAVSRQIQALERSFNVRLFRREGRQFVLTEGGQTLFEQANEILGRMEALHDRVSQQARQPAGRVSLGMPWAAGEYLLPSILQQYRKRYPQVALHVIQAYSDVLADGLASGELDLAILYGRPRAAELSFTPLMNLQLGLIAPPLELGDPDHLGTQGRVSFARAMRLPLILSSRGQALRDLVEKVSAEQGLSPSIVIEVESLVLSRALVQVGEGYSLLAYGGVHELVEAGKLRYFSIHSPSLPWSMSLAVRRDKHVTPAMSAMMDECITSIRRKVSRRTWRGRAVADDTSS